MATKPPVPIPIPLSSFPGANPQEAAGRLINCTAEPLGEGNHATGPASQVWRRQPGLSQFNNQATGQTGYRGGMVVGGLSYNAWLNNASTVDIGGNYTALGPFPGTKKVSFARNQAAVPDVVAVDPDNGAYILATSNLASAHATATVAGGPFNSSDEVDLFIQNIGADGFPVSIIYTLASSENANTVAAGLVNLINANATLAAAGFTANMAGANITFNYPGAIGNSTIVSATITGNETVTFFPADGTLSGGRGTPGIVFTGPPLFYNALGVLPQPNSVCFQDQYFFFTTGAGACYATKNNSLDMNALTFIQVVSKSDVILLRAIPFSGLLWLFTTGNCEVWQDTAQPYPGFPYSRLLPIEYGLLQSGAIAGWETGFSELIWVAQDFGVWWCTAGGSPSPVKVSPPDLDRLIERAYRAGLQLEAGCYAYAGKKFWTLSCADWTWEFNVGTKKWAERTSLNATLGTQVRWRAQDGHPAFNRWLMGDTQSGNLLWVNQDSYTENGAPQLFRIETGPVRNFPNQIRIARADFDFDVGVANYLSTDPEGQNPTCAISLSKDGGFSFDIPSIRALGVLGRTKRQRISVKNRGLSGPQGCRWRMDVTAPVYVALLGATQSSDPREIGS